MGVQIGVQKGVQIGVQMGFQIGVQTGSRRESRRGPYGVQKGGPDEGVHVLYRTLERAKIKQVQHDKILMCTLPVAAFD